MRFVNEDESVEVGEYGKRTLSLDELSGTLEQLDFQIRFLSGLVYQEAHEPISFLHAGIQVQQLLYDVLGKKSFEGRKVDLYCRIQNSIYFV